MPVTFNAGAGETFAAHAEKGLHFQFLLPGGGASQGDVVSVLQLSLGTGTSAITITDATNLPNWNKGKVNRNHS